MSSGRDVMMDRWRDQVAQAEQNIRESQKEQYQNRMLTRMIEYRQTLITELERLDKAINGEGLAVWPDIIKAAILAEREACAKVCKDIANSQFESGETETAGVLDHCAAAIRARGDK